MRKLIWILSIVFIGCTLVPTKDNSASSSYKNSTSLTEEELDKELDSLNAEGECCVVRGSDREYDTIIDHIKYRYVRDLGYDTPIDSLKCEINK